MSTFSIKDQFKYYTFLTVLYTVFIITAQAVAYRFIQIGSFIEPGGIFIFPATFTVTDVIAEVYGPTLARKTIFIALIAQAFFTFATIAINAMPLPTNHMTNFEAFKIVFGSSWLVYLSNVTAIIVGMILNVQLIGKTKILVHGRFFALRSFGVTALSELILTIIIVSIAIIPIVGIQKSKELFLNMFLFKMFFTLFILFPASILVISLKKAEGVDVYEQNVSINPLNWLKKFQNQNIVSLSEHIQKKDTS